MKRKRFTEEQIIGILREEMGELAVYLASDLSAFMTGQAIAIDRGYSIR